jgi:hypothetical protein
MSRLDRLNHSSQTKHPVSRLRDKLVVSAIPSPELVREQIRASTPYDPRTIAGLEACYEAGRRPRDVWPLVVRAKSTRAGWIARIRRWKAAQQRDDERVVPCCCVCDSLVQNRLGEIGGWDGDEGVVTSVVRRERKVIDGVGVAIVKVDRELARKVSPELRYRRVDCEDDATGTVGFGGEEFDDVLRTDIGRESCDRRKTRISALLSQYRFMYWLLWNRVKKRKETHIW